MFIRTMPIYICILMKIFSDFILILNENCFPKFMYIHLFILLKISISQFQKPKSVEFVT